jgi:hypothetical protein
MADRVFGKNELFSAFFTQIPALRFFNISIINI